MTEEKTAIQHWTFHTSMTHTPVCTWSLLPADSVTCCYTGCGTHAHLPRESGKTENGKQKHFSHSNQSWGMLWNETFICIHPAINQYLAHCFTMITNGIASQWLFDQGVVCNCQLCILLSTSLGRESGKFYLRDNQQVCTVGKGRLSAFHWQKMVSYEVKCLCTGLLNIRGSRVCWCMFGAQIYAHILQDCSGNLDLN